MFTPYDEQEHNDAVSLASGGTPEPSDTPEYASVRNASNITGAASPSGRVKDPLGTRYNRMKPSFSQTMSGIGGLSGTLAASATPTPADRVAAQDSEHSVVTDNQPASFSPARMTSSVIHTDQPLDRARVDELFARHTKRRFAF